LVKPPAPRTAASDWIGALRANHQWQELPFFAIAAKVRSERMGASKETQMQSMNISLPEPLKQFVDGQISKGRYSSASEYVRELIRADEKRKAEEELEARLLEGLNSPESELTSSDWRAIRSEALARLQTRRKQPR
jgi:antitoxin ParD1/3/4